MLPGISTFMTGSQSLTTTMISAGAGSTIGNMTGGGGLAAAFDGTTSQSSAAGARGLGGLASAQIGKDWGSGVTKTITKFITYCPNDDGYRGDAAAIGYSLQGSPDNSAWTTLYSGTLPAGSNQGATTVTAGITTSTAYRYHRINLTGNSANALNIAEVQFFEDI